ncbi:hypothetical protein BURCENBC7_AP1288 [Burkholderia cenocepacia BC7]|nr:hypothetical protein BURCENBC7_AP1288 [Burkholderia cenocepacia BC7]
MRRHPIPGKDLAKPEGPWSVDRLLPFMSMVASAEKSSN